MLKNLKRNCILWILSNLCWIDLCKAYESSSLSAETVVFQNNDLILSGQVSLSHALLSMHAEEARLLDYHKNNSLPFSSTLLSGNVSLDFQNRAQLTCNLAHLDFQTLLGSIESAKDPIIYQDLVRETPLQIEARQGALKLLNQDLKNQNYTLESLFLNQDVHIQYGDIFSLYTDEAKFYAGSGVSKEKIHAQPNPIEGICKLLYKNNLIHATSMDIDLSTLNMIMTSPQGILDPLNSSCCTFHADNLYADHEDHTFTLTGHAHIENKELGTLDTENSLCIKQDNRSIQTITCKGLSSLKILESKQEHLFTCSDYLVFDKTLLQVTAFSHPTKQNLYTQNNLMICADTTAIHYTKKESSMKPEKVFFTGNVRIASKGPIPYEGLADTLIYDIASGHASLAALPSKKVLFYHANHHLTISADELTIDEDPATHEPHFEGKGHVRFTFNKQDDHDLEKPGFFHASS
ncbi:MAG: hypothetical protein WCG10_07920 [Chlamydiota bacterium]